MEQINSTVNIGNPFFFRLLAINVDRQREILKAFAEAGYSISVSFFPKMLYCTVYFIRC